MKGMAGSMFVEAINHVQLAMPAGEEAEARHFYADLLGIPEVDKPPHLAARGGCWFERGALKVHLGVERDFRPARKAHPAFTVSDLVGLVQRLARQAMTLLRTSHSSASIVGMCPIHSAIASSSWSRSPGNPRQAPHTSLQAEQVTAVGQFFWLTHPNATCSDRISKAPAAAAARRMPMRRDAAT